MAEELVRARVGDIETHMGRSLAEASEGVEVLDEPAVDPAGRLRPDSKRGRPIKKKTTVAESATAKKAAAVAATDTAKEA